MERGLAGTWKLVLEGNMKKPLSAEQGIKRLEGPLADNNFEDTCLDGAGLKVNRDIGWMNKKKRMKKRGYYGQICQKIGFAVAIEIDDDDDEVFAGHSFGIESHEKALELYPEMEVEVGLDRRVVHCSRYFAWTIVQKYLIPEKPVTYDDAGYFASSVECFHDDVSHAARNYDLVGVGVVLLAIVSVCFVTITITRPAQWF